MDTVTDTAASFADHLNMTAGISNGVEFVFFGFLFGATTHVLVP